MNSRKTKYARSTTEPVKSIHLTTAILALYKTNNLAPLSNLNLLRLNQISIFLSNLSVSSRKRKDRTLLRKAHHPIYHRLQWTNQGLRSNSNKLNNWNLRAQLYHPWLRYLYHPASPPNQNNQNNSTRVQGFSRMILLIRCSVWKLPSALLWLTRTFGYR